jgi:DNA-binding NarL/FixJ family response regulator
MTGPARLLVVADGAPAAEAVRAALGRSGSFSVLGYAAGGAPAGAAIALARPDVVLVDQLARREDVVARVEEARAAAAAAKIVALADDLGSPWLAAVQEAGADALICRAPGPGLGLLLREVVAGRLYHRFAPAPPAPTPGLTAREQEVLALVAAGTPNGRIARQLWVTEQTVKFHLSNIYRKLGVTNRTEASHYAYVHRLLDARPAVTALATATAA